MRGGAAQKFAAKLLPEGLVEDECSHDALGDPAVNVVPSGK